MDNVPSIRNLSTDQALDKIHRYLQSNKQELEYWLQMVNTGVSLEDSKNNIFGDVTLTDIDEWNKIKDITDKLGNVIAEKLQGNINTAIANIMNGTSTVEFNEIGIYIHDQPSEDESTWAMMLSAQGLMIADGKIENPINQTWSWNWRTFGTGKGFTADDITTGTLSALTLEACNILASNITSGTLKSVTISTALLNGNEINGGKITGTEIIGVSISAGTIDGAYISGGEIEATTINASTFNTANMVAPLISAAEIEGGNIIGTTISGNTIEANTLNANILNGNTINGGTITGAVVQSIGEEGDGVALFDKGYYVYGPGENVVVAALKYDTTGAGTIEEAANRVFFGTENGYALKIYSAGDISISAAGSIFITDNRLKTSNKTVTGAINEVFQYTTDALNTFATSIKSKGGSVAEPVNKTNINNGILSIPQEGGGSSVEVTTPLFNTTDELFNYYGWVDVRAIADSYAGFANKSICILNTVADYVGTPYSSSVSVVRSDGYSGKSSTWPAWDTSKDLVDNFGNKYRWVMYDSVNFIDTSDSTILYMYLDQATYSKSTFPILKHTRLIMFDISDRFATALSKITNYEYFCNSCKALVKLPDNLDTSNGTNFTYFCYACYSLSRLPDNLNTSKGIYFNGFCDNCTQLSALPDNLDTSSGVQFNSFCNFCLNLTKLPDNLNTSKGLYFDSFLYDCHAFEKLPDNLDVSNGISFYNFCASCFSLAEIPEQLKFSSATSLRGAFSSTRIRRIPPGLNTSNVTNFSGFCNYCRWLTDVTILDLSKTTSIPSMFVDCYLLPYDIVTKLKG